MTCSAVSGTLPSVIAQIVSITAMTPVNSIAMNARAMR